MGGINAVGFVNTGVEHNENLDGKIFGSNVTSGHPDGISNGSLSAITFRLAAV